VDNILPLRRLVARLATVAVSSLVIALFAAGPTARAADAAAQVVPHRAIYKMSLLSARSASKITDVRGRMLFEWADACDGWTTEQRFQLRFVYAEGDETNMTTNYATWEAKDGRSYRFNVRKTVNGEADDEVRGDAQLTAPSAAAPSATAPSAAAPSATAPSAGQKSGDDQSGGVAHFVRPDDNEMALPLDTLFPTAHTLAVLEHASKGDTFFMRTVFDGADADGATAVSAVIGRAEPTRTASTDPLIKDQKAWPVRMAFFPLKSDSPQPEYEMSLRLLPSGIAESMVIDYGDFTVNAVLEQIEALAKSGC
jgi:hypothetical protein